MFLTEEQEQLRKEVRAFAEREIAPHVSEWDEKSEFPHAVVKKLGEMGLLGVIFPEELGGAGMGYVEYVVAIDELSRVDGSVGIIVAAHNSLCTNHIMLAGNDEQRKRWIPKLASGAWLGAWGLTEPGSGSDAGGARTTAVKRGDKWVLNGSKTFITNGTYANCAVILAVTDKEKGREWRDLGVCGGEGDAGISAGEEGEQAGAAGERYGRADLRELRDSGGEPGGQTRRGFQGCDAGAGWRKDLDCGAEPGDGARRSGCGGEVLRRSGGSSARRSGSFRRSSSSWPIWRRSWMRRGC